MASYAASPDGPRCTTRLPQRLEDPQIAKGIHRLPEAEVLERDQLAVRRKTLEGLALEQDVVAGDPLEDRRLEDEEAAIHPGAVANGLFLEGPNAWCNDAADRFVIVDVEGSKTAERLYGRDGSKPAVRAMELELLLKVDIGDAIAVRHH